MSGGVMMGAAWSASPAAGRCMSGEPFVLNGRVGKVEERFPSHAGLQADALLIRFDESAPGQIGLLGTTVKSLEQHIEQGRVHFLESAAALNVRHGGMGHVVSTTRKCRSDRSTKPRAEVFANQPTPPRRSIVEGRIGFPSASSAKRSDLSRGRDREGLILGSQGIAPGGDE